MDYAVWMITVHHLNNSRSHRILWMLEELGQPYEIKYYQRNPVTMLAPPELKQVHPLGKSPVLTDGAVVMAESAAILEYLADTYGGASLKPAGGEERRLYTQFLHYAEGSLMPPLLVALIFGKLTGPPTPIVARPMGKLIYAGVQRAFLGPQLKTHLDFVENHLSRHEWFAGTFSAADIQMSFPVEAALARGLLDGRPSSRKFVERIRAREGYRRAIARGGDLDLNY